MKSFKEFFNEGFNVPPRNRYTASSKNIDFRGTAPAGFLGSNGIAFPISSDNLILKFKKRRVKKKFRSR